MVVTVRVPNVGAAVLFLREMYDGAGAEVDVELIVEETSDLPPRR